METHYTNHSFNFQRNWSVRQKPIYRLLNKIEYLDNFFQEGELLLSCFNVFKKYKNEIQGDKREGSAMIVIDAPENKQIGMYYNSGINAYVLSTTKNPSKQNITDFKAVGAIKINNPTIFATEVSNRIPFYIGGVEGDCKYVDKRIIRKQLDSRDSDNFKIENFNNIQNQFDLLNKYSQNDETFLKEMKYSPQEEYRLVWYVQKNISKHSIIKCPEVIQLCEKIVF